MQAWSLIAIRMKNGNWKVKVMGNADAHFDSWCGENGRIRTAPGQPYAGFDIIDDALLWAAQRFPTMDSLIAWGQTVGDGQWTDGREYEGSVPADTHWEKDRTADSDNRALKEAGVRDTTQSVLDELKRRRAAAPAPAKAGEA